MNAWEIVFLLEPLKDSLGEYKTIGRIPDLPGDAYDPLVKEKAWKVLLHLIPEPYRYSLAFANDMVKFHPFEDNCKRIEHLINYLEEYLILYQKKEI